MRLHGREWQGNGGVHGEGWRRQGRFPPGRYLGDCNHAQRSPGWPAAPMAAWRGHYCPLGSGSYGGAAALAASKLLPGDCAFASWHASRMQHARLPTARPVRVHAQAPNCSGKEQRRA